MSRCKFTLPAKRDLKEIAAYIRRDNPEAAERVVKRIQDVCREMLVNFPAVETMREDWSAGLGCFSVENYVIYFRGRDPVQVVRVLHGAGDVTPAMFS